MAQLVGPLGFKSVLDYGCGKGGLKPALQALYPDLIITEYDPAIPERASDPREAELVVCLDVAEHIEPDRLDAALAHISSQATKAVFMTICARLANKTLADGRNAHLIVQPQEWWVERLGLHFVVAQAKYLGGSDTIVVAVLQPRSS